MKVNPTKCTFGVEEGKFLGYQISKEGILSNPTKIQEFLESKTPRNLKGMQEINGRLTTLGRFIAISIEKFKWTEKSDVALQQLKDTLHQLSTLACPLPGETLQMYLVASEEAISSVLTVERESKQISIHFVSGSLQEPEVNFPSLEKLVLALVYAARGLRRYFQTHKVDVLTSYLIKQVLLRPEKSGRLAKWAIELGEHDIHYHPQSSIKAQALIDFLVEIPDTIKGVPTMISIDPLEPEASKEL
uniref:Reverse transcriptase/retrotransposon-derived protein RNase H-like domain-containing protein n=1 Tax=Lactuca sativa TaxID=4236 RepID=A0A9R1X273_LACSA|nr:hypothetical protein LSAT_V11C800404610 [Lactuca sativa]